MGGHQPPVRILVVDDEEVLLELLGTGLRYEGFEVEVVRDGNAALALAARWRPHLVILDWMLPGLDGYTVCQRLRLHSDVAILMLTAKSGLDERVAGLDAGADDYLVKPFKFKELLARMRAVLRRHHLSLTGRLTLGDLCLDRDTRELWRGERPIALTPREFELLEVLLAHPRQILTREMLLNRIWGYETAVDPNVVEVVVSTLRDKIGDRDRRLIRTVRGVGYTLRG